MNAIDIPAQAFDAIAMVLIRAGMAHRLDTSPVDLTGIKIERGEPSGLTISPTRPATRRRRRSTSEA